MQRRILIVDDIEINRKVLGKMLADEYSITEAENGKAALDIIKNEGKNLSAILLDLMMPEMDGFDVLRSIAASPALAQIPVMVTTGNTEAEAELMALELGANDFITKPFVPAIIKRRLKNLINLRESTVEISVLQHDSLTGLYNRDVFFEKASALIAGSAPGSYVITCADIDNFKVINDQYGTPKGDDVLRRAARAFDEELARVGGLACRITADTFALLSPRKMLDSGALDALCRKAELLDGSINPVSISAGHYIIADKELSPGAMYDRAAIAKATIKGRYDRHAAIYDESMRLGILRAQEIVSEMTSALKERRFEIFLQPQYNHTTGALIGSEALVRWRHPANGVISPAAFIPVFERNGFIYELDKFVWEEACALLRRWLDEERAPLPISVNVSRYDLFRPDLIESVCALIKKYELPRDLLRLEITESAFSEDTKHVISIVQQLVDMGFTIEIDDFGSGYSSLNTLKDVPAQIIKLDMRFLENDGNSDRGGNILESIVRMTKWLGLSVIAEGVETAEQAEYLKTIGCSYVQGYLYARPMPVSDFEALARNVRKEKKLITIETVENLDNNAFWDPKSMDTLIFNSYVGGACIFEYHNNKIEILRANEKYARTLGGPDATIQDALNMAWDKHMTPEAAAATHQAILTALETGEDSVYEAAYTNLFGLNETTWLRTTFRALARTGDRYLLFGTNENITAQRRAEQQLRRTYAQLRGIISGVNGGVSAATYENGAFKFIFANEQYYAIYGYTREQFAAELARGFLDIIHPDDYSKAIDYLANGDVSAEPSVMEFRVRRRDGRQIWVRSRGSIIKLEGVEQRVHIAVTTDITGEKQADERIRALNENLLVMMNDTPGGFSRMRVHPDGGISTEYVNDNFCELRGMTREEILLADFNDALSSVHPDDLNEVRAAVVDMISTGKTRSLTYRIKHSSGKYIPFTVFGRVTRNADNEIYINAYYAFLTPDEQKQITTREILPYLLSAITESATDLVFAKDKDFKYICCSPAFVKFTRQKTQADVIGKNDYDFFTKEEADHFRSDDIRLFETGEPLIDYIEPIPSDDGIQHYCSTSKYILRDATGEIIGMYGIGRDITEYRTTFERLKLLADSISGGLITYTMTPSGIRVTYFNDGLCRLFDCTREEYALATRDNIITAVFEEDVPALQKQITNLMKDGAPINATYRIHSMRDDSFKWVNLRVASIERQGEAMYANAVVYDVTEQKLAEEAALVHEEEMRLAMAQLGKIICEFDVATRTLIMPDYYAARYGLGPRVSGMPDNEQALRVIDEEYADAYKKFFNSIIRGEKNGAAEYREIWTDGTPHWEYAEFYTVYDAKKKPIKAIIALMDTTNQHLQYEIEQNRPSLGEENLLVHALFNLTTGETLDYSYRDGNIVPLIDRTALHFAGEHIDNLIISESERENYRIMNDKVTLLEKYARGETEQSIDYRRLLPNGEIVWVRNIMRMIRKPGGSDVLLFDYFYNVEEEKLREQMYVALIYANYDYVTRINGKSKRYALIANENVKFGIPPASGDNLDDAAREMAEKYVHPDDCDMVIRNTSVAGIKKNLAMRDRFTFTCRLVRPDGSIRYKKFTESYLDREREILLLTREDVSSAVHSEMRKNEQLSDALTAANQASKAKSQFLSRMSHELRTPMNAIIGLSALSATELNNPTAMADSISKIGMSARYLLSLINDILEMSRIESGRLTLNESPFDFEQLIASVNTIIYAQTQAKGLDYDVIVNNYTEPVYIGDTTKLQEILVNVLGNAVKFTPSGGKVTLTIEQLRCVNKRATLRFTITDTGVGIDEDFIADIFEPFSQELSNIIPATSGTGLGLAITKNLVSMMNGQITVKSIKNVGSVFTIDIQLGVSRERREHIELLSTLNLENLRALVVDDDVIVCKSTESILTSMGIKAEWVDSGLLAVERVREAKRENKDFDTIFIDWKMPDIDGIETTRRIRKIVGPEVTIIIITAFDWQSIEIEAREAGADMFMDKPLFQSSIVKAFERVFMANREKIEPPPQLMPDFAGVRLLLAEDHPLNVEVAKRLLEKVNAEVVVVNNGLEALETFATSEDGYFDAILMDIRMPVMDGLTASKNIRKLRKKGSQFIPIIAMTANAFDEDVELSLSSGMNAHLTKPIEPHVMYATLDRLINR